MNSTRPTRVACAQLAPTVGDLEGNRARALEAIASALAEDADIVVLPELASSGYVFESAAEARALAEPADGATIRGWIRAARKRDSVVVGGFCELGPGGELFNAAAAVDGNRILAVYRKLHLWDRERLVFTPGDAPAPVVRTRFGSIGIAICYDAVFPELTRSLSLAGAELLAVPTNSPALDEPHGTLPLEVVNAMATAYVNRVFVAVADRCGRERGIEWVGGSVVADCTGELVAGPAGPAGPALLLADIELERARDKRWGERNDVFADRRPGLDRIE